MFEAPGTPARRIIAPCTSGWSSWAPTSSSAATRWPTSRCGSRGSRSRSTAASRASSGSSRSTRSPGWSPPPSGTDRARAQAARPGAQPVHPRRLPRAADPQGPGRARPSWSSAPRAIAGECVGLRVPRDVYIHVSGIDLIRDADGRFLVLEDNCRTPSGVSYVLKNRQVMKQVFPLAVRAVQRPAGRRLHRQPAGRAPLDRAGGLRRSRRSSS